MKEFNGEYTRDILLIVLFIYQNRVIVWRILSDCRIKNGTTVNILVKVSSFLSTIPKSSKLLGFYEHNVL